MLLAALGATVIGFVLLIVALITANLWLAIACVVVSVIGVGLLLADVLTYRRGDRDASLVGTADREDDAAPWSPGDDQADEEPASSADTEAQASAASGPSIGDAEREARTVGSEDFGHHERDITDEAQADDDRPTTFIPKVASDEWSHESAADTDAVESAEQPAEFRGLLAPGTYDPDMTDQIPQVEAEHTWGSQWSPPEGTGDK